MSLRLLAGRVWLYPHDPDPDKVQPCVAVISDDSGSVLVDAGNSPAHARDVRDAIEAAGLPAPRTIVYTHHHWDHVWGACAWPDVEVVGHRAGARVLHAEARRPWSTRYLRDEVAANPRLGPSFRARERAMRSWDGFTIVPPHVEFDTAISLPAGVEVRHVGGGHAEDSTVIWVPDSGVVLLGDSFYPPPYHLRRPGDGFDNEVIKTVLDAYRGAEWYVDSHDDPHPRSALEDLLPAPAE
jgi:glyoxylase-like metal-dependent hydrolase (beta-lactamase superfamily II)